MDSHDPDTGRLLAEALGDLAVRMQALTHSGDVLHAIVDGAVHIVPGTASAGVSRVVGRSIEVAVTTHAAVAELDELQTAMRQGPAFTTLEAREPLRIDNFAADERWPRFTAAAVAAGVCSALSFRLDVQRGTIGVLTLYGSEPHAFTDDAAAIGEILAQHAAVGLAGSTSAEQLQSAVASRDIIGQAKGILMQRDRLTGLQAFATLTKASQETNVRLVDVARWLVNEHESGLESR